MDAAGSAMRVCDGGSAQAPAKKKKRERSLLPAGRTAALQTGKDKTIKEEEDDGHKQMEFCDVEC